MKKRTRIFSLLDRYSVREQTVSVTIIGETTGTELYVGKLWEVPFKFCIDYVLFYEFDEQANHLKIVETLSAI